MNLDNNDIEREEILYRYFGNELTSDEKEEVDSWRGQHPENETTFTEARINYLDLKGLAYYRNTENVDHSWDQFKTENNVRSIQSHSSSTSIFLKYAASVLIIVSAAFGIYYIQNQPKEVIIAANEIQQVSLPDDSQITLNEHATVKYEKRFSATERILQLTGDAHFDIARNTERPFVVKAGETEIRVLGTKFFVHQPNAGTLQVSVEEGKVLVSYQDIHEILAAGQSLSLDLKEKEVTFEENQSGLTTFWKNRKLVFDLTPVDEVIATVNQAYGSSLQLEGNTEGCALTVIFDNESLVNVVEVISRTLNYEVSENQGTYTLKANGCQ